MKTHPVSKERMSAEDFERETIRRRTDSAMATPQHMKLWLDESGRRWLVFDAHQLIDALPWPGGVQEVTNLVHLYDDYRRRQDSGRTEKQIDPMSKEEIDVPIFKTGKLELDELDRAIRYLAAQAYALDPQWSIENPAL